MDMTLKHGLLFSVRDKELFPFLRLASPTGQANHTRMSLLKPNARNHVRI